MNMNKAAGAATVALVGYHTLVRPRMLRWGASPGEQHIQLPGDDIASGMPPGYTKGVTIEAPPEVVWPWLVQIGDHRAGFYSYDWPAAAPGCWSATATGATCGPPPHAGSCFFGPRSASSTTSSVTRCTSPWNAR